MILKESNFNFEPNSWKDLRQKGFSKFVFVPVFVTAILMSILFYFFDEKTKGNLLASLLVVLVACLTIYLSRITTWLWKEYKFKRYTNNIITYNKVDLIISIANLFRIALNISIIIVIFIYVTSVL